MSAKYGRISTVRSPFFVCFCTSSSGCAEHNLERRLQGRRVARLGTQHIFGVRDVVPFIFGSVTRVDADITRQAVAFSFSISSAYGISSIRRMSIDSAPPLKAERERRRKGQEHVGD